VIIGLYIKECQRVTLPFFVDLCSETRLITINYGVIVLFIMHINCIMFVLFAIFIFKEYSLASIFGHHRWYTKTNCTQLKRLSTRKCQIIGLVSEIKFNSIRNFEYLHSTTLLKQKFSGLLK